MLTLPAQLLRPHICSLSMLPRSQHRCLCFVYVRFPAAVSHGAAIPALLPPAGWHSCCALQVFPAKAMEIWLMTLTRAGRDPAGCKLWPRSLDLVQSFFANRFILGLSGFRLLSLSHHETDTSGFLVTLLDKLLPCFYRRHVVLESTQNTGVDPQLFPQLLNLMVLGKKRSWDDDSA